MLALVFAFGAFGSDVDAQEYDSFYGSVALGATDFEDGYLGVGYQDTPLSLEAVAGYRFDWIWSVEATLQTLGDVERRNVAGSGLDRLDIKTDVNATSLRIRLWVPLSDLYDMQNPMDVFGFAGIQRTRIDRSAIETNSARTFAQRATDYGPTMGVGLTYEVRGLQWRTSLNWARLEAPGGSMVSATIGFEFSF